MSGPNTESPDLSKLSSEAIAKIGWLATAAADSPSMTSSVSSGKLLTAKSDPECRRKDAR